MPKTISAEKRRLKLCVLQKIKQHKDILFGPMNKHTKEIKIRLWRGLSQYAKSIGVLQLNREFGYLRDVWWPNVRKFSLEKLETVENGGEVKEFNEIDEMIFTIVGTKIPTVEKIPTEELDESSVAAEFIQLEDEEVNDHDYDLNLLESEVGSMNGPTIVSTTSIRPNNKSKTCFSSMKDERKYSEDMIQRKNLLEWTDNQVLSLIEEYKSYSCLWDPSDPHYKVLQTKFDAWSALSDEFGCSVEKLKKKINSILSSYRRERRKEKNTSRMGSEEVFKSKWFAFDALSFLQDKFKSSMEDPETSYFEQDDDDDDADMVEVFNSKSVINNSKTVKKPHEPGFAKRHRKLPQHGKKKLTKLDAQFLEAFSVIKNVSENIGAKKAVQKTPAEAFGDYIASKLNGYDEYTRNTVQFKINSLLFEADMGFFSNEVTVGVPDHHSRASTSPRGSPTVVIDNNGVQVEIVESEDI